jgi:hypothetical protein
MRAPLRIDHRNAAFTQANWLKAESHKRIDSHSKAPQPWTQGTANLRPDRVEVSALHDPETVGGRLTVGPCDIGFCAVRRRSSRVIQPPTLPNSGTVDSLIV